MTTLNMDRTGEESRGEERRGKMIKHLPSV
jgi:hypothetical protein